LTTEQGIFNPAKNAWYDSDNNRILNYVKPGTSGGTCILDISGYVTQDITLNPGWYYADAAGAGGGNAPGIYTLKTGDGGRLKKSFYVPFTVLAKAFSGSKGANGNGVVGGGGGAGSVLYIPRLKLLFIASGGGGAYAGNGASSGGNGGNGGVGNGSNGSNNATIPGGKSDGGAYGDSTVSLLLGTASVAGGAGGIAGNAEGKPGNNNVDSTSGGGGAGAKVSGSAAEDGWVRIYKTAELMGAV
jgi:hypothetical protein